MYHTDPGMASNDSEQPAAPIRFKVSYRSAESLVTEYTTCVSKGGCALVAKRRVAPGTRFVFEMRTPGQAEPLEIEGEVVRVRAIKATSNFEVGVQYKAVGPQREVVESLLSKIGVDPNYELVRRYPRIPVNLVAQDRDLPVTYLIRDLSRSGMRLEGRSFADDIRLGTPIELHVWLGSQSTPVSIRGQIAWLQRGSRVVRTLLGVKFDRPSDSAAAALGRLTQLHRPARLELTIGDDVPETRVNRRRSALGARDLSERIKNIASRILVDMPSLHVTPATGAPAGDGIAVRLGLFGDVEGELVLEISTALGKRIATEVLGHVSEADAPKGELAGLASPEMDRSMAVDAVMEWATVLGGRVCDYLEEQNVELELTAPVEGIPMPRLDDFVAIASFRGPFGGVVVSVITREVSPSAWPV